MENHPFDEENREADLAAGHAASELCALLGCTPEEMRGALQLAGGEPEKAMTFLQSVLPSALAVKGVFEGRRANDPSGAFCFVFEGPSGKELDAVLWVGFQRFSSNFAVEADWEAVRLALTEITAPLDKSLLRSIQRLLESALDPTSVNRLFRGQESSDSLTERLSETLSNHLRVDVFLRLHVETFNRLRLQQAGLLSTADEERVEREKDQETREKSPATLESIRVRCRPLLDPVRGQPLSQIRKGQRLHVAFEDQAGLAGLIVRMMVRSGRPLVFPVSSVSKSPVGDHLIELDLADGVVGVVKQTEDLRVRIDRGAVERPPLSRNGLLLLYLGAGLLLALALFHWFSR